jgi:dihydrofolate reductase
MVSARRSNTRRRAAGGQDVSLAGGANAARKFLVAGPVDEMEICLVPALLGSGERLFEGSDDLQGLELVRRRTEGRWRVRGASRRRHLHAPQP